MTLRDRRRAAATREILDMAREQIAERGPAGLALRAVARDLGMTVQALYHYFPSRDDLVTALIIEAYDDLADAMHAALHPGLPADAPSGGETGRSGPTSGKPDSGRASSRPDSGRAFSSEVTSREAEHCRAEGGGNRISSGEHGNGGIGGGGGLPAFVVAAESFREWAIGNVARFQLIYGTPLRDYRAPEDGRTTAAAARVAGMLREALFGGWSDAELRRADVPDMDPLLGRRLGELPAAAVGALPPAAASLFIAAWGQIHGLVVLEAFGHTAFLAPAQAQMFRTAMLGALKDIQRRLPRR